MSLIILFFSSINLFPKKGKLIVETERLNIRELSINRDEEFIFELLNQPSWIKYIGQRNINSLEDAQSYIQNGPAKSYKENGFGLYLVEIKQTEEKIGICGLLRRPNLEHVDIGYALLERHFKKGYASESASAILKDGFEKHSLEKILAIVLPENQASIHLLDKIGMKFVEKRKMDHKDEELLVYEAVKEI